MTDTKKEQSKFITAVDAFAAEIVASGLNPQEIKVMISDKEWPEFARMAKNHFASIGTHDDYEINGLRVIRES